MAAQIAALDDEVILGLIQLSKLQSFSNRKVNFTRYQLIKLLGWRDESKSYDRIEKSLNRWVGVTLYAVFGGADFGAGFWSLFLGFLWMMSRWKDIRRVFEYHGAEHKTINAYEAGAELTPESVAQYPLAHARCGTAFLLTLVLISILVFTFLGPLPMFWRLASRVLLIPVIAGIAVEYIRWTANHLDSPIVQFMIKPNLALQSLTTREPDRSMLEVAIESFKTMRNAEQELVA
jgi:hypothetical protein